MTSGFVLGPGEGSAYGFHGSGVVISGPDGRLVREFHDLTVGTPLAGDAQVVASIGPEQHGVPPGGPGLCPVAFIDWDLAAPGRGVREDTLGQLGVIESVYPAGLSVHEHVHAGEDEMFYLLGGEMEVFCGVTAGPWARAASSLCPATGRTASP